MRLLVAGGDARYACLAEQARRAGWNVRGVGLERARGDFPRCGLEDVGQADCVLLPNPWRRGIQLPLAEQPFTLEQLLGGMRREALLLLSDAEGAPDALPFRVRDLTRDEAFVRQNAQLTAEGAIAAVLRGGWALADRRCLVLGYGRIGQSLTRALRGLRASVTVCARRANARALARDAGASVCSFEGMTPLLGSFDVVFNTAPARVLDAGQLCALSSRAALIDLASPPYGFDLTEARELGLNARRESGLPGRYCPESAAQALLQAVGRALEREDKEATGHE